MGLILGLRETGLKWSLRRSSPSEGTGRRWGSMENTKMKKILLGGAAFVAGLALAGGLVWWRHAHPAPVVANTTVTLDVTGMHCDGCAAGLTSELRRLGGVATAEVSLTNKSAVVSFDSNRVAMAGLLKAVSEAGFEGKTR